MYVHIVSFYMFINDNIVILATFVMYHNYYNMKCVNLFLRITFPIFCGGSCFVDGIFRQVCMTFVFGPPLFAMKRLP